jgi:hypothetical protein
MSYLEIPFDASLEEIGVTANDDLVNFEVEVSASDGEIGALEVLNLRNAFRPGDRGRHRDRGY